jgi:hypothetical protein
MAVVMVGGVVELRFSILKNQHLLMVKGPGPKSDGQQS